MIVNILKKTNTVLTVVSAVYTVTKFMIRTFKKYEEKHGRGKRSNGTGVKGDIQESHEIPKKVVKRTRKVRNGDELHFTKGKKP